jgi:hypothetical protein
VTLGETLNNRELAFAAWMILFFAWAMTKSGFRTSLKGVGRALVNEHILTIIAVMAVYIALMVWGLRELGFWDASQLKTTIIWAISVAFVSLLDLQSIAEDADYFKKSIKDNLKLIVVLEFLISFYTLGLLAEFLVVIPVSTVIGAATVYAGTDKKYAPVEKLLSNVMALFGAALVGHALYKLTTEFASFATRDTLVEFSLPPVLSFLFLPFLYALAAFASYEKTFIRIGFTIKEPALLSYAKRQSVLRFRLDTTLLKRWATRLQMMNPTTKADIDSGFLQVFEMRELERNPPPVSAAVGWSPYAAKSFLVSHGLKTGYYQPSFDDQWSASSSYKNLGDGIMPNNVAYYIDGDKSAATELRLALNMNEPASAADAVVQFVALAGALHQAAFNGDMPKPLAYAVSSVSDFSSPDEDKRVSVRKKMWGGQSSGKYTLEFSIQKGAAMRRKIPDNFTLLHTGEEFLRGKSIAAIEDSEKFLEHAALIERSMDLINYFVRQYKTENDDLLTIQLLGIRLFNAAASSIQLLLSGYYQTSALQQRDMLETIFLLDYFRTYPEKIAGWRQSDTKTRQKEFSPVVIRKALDERDDFTEKRREKAYKQLSELAGHPTYAGFRMLTPQPGGDAHCGPFFEATSFKAVYEELTKHLIQAGTGFMRFFPGKIAADQKMKISFMETQGQWFEKFYNQPFDRKQIEELKALAQAMEQQEKGT